MRNILISAVTAGAIISIAGAATAQQIYLNFGPNPGYGPPPPGYGPPPPGYGPGYSPGYGPGYGPAPGPYYRSERIERGYYRPGRFRTWNGCQQGWTVQDGLCKPYRGY
jgi:hypothetical protein